MHRSTLACIIGGSCTNGSFASRDSLDWAFMTSLSI